MLLDATRTTGMRIRLALEIRMTDSEREIWLTSRRRAIQVYRRNH